MDLSIHPFTVHKQIPLTISRGTTSASTNLWIRVQAEGIEGWGEAVPFSIGSHMQTTETIRDHLQRLQQPLEELHPLQHQQIQRLMRQSGTGTAAQAGLDIALHDWLGKKVGLPLWQLWGLDRSQIGPTSVTIGISTPEAACQRLQRWLQLFPIRSLKVKLGNPQGIEADQAMLAAILDHLPTGTKVSVDANGGWALETALTMGPWLAERGITYVEQPLPPGQEDDLTQLYPSFPLPIYVDESCFTSKDIPALMGKVHGINIKLMKCGGLTEARRMISTARACNLDILLGCYSDSALANTALSHLSSLATYVDLDSHLNLKDDPFVGAQLHDGCLIPVNQAGLGISQNALLY